ncbi:MAG: carboxypeptidase regulatory-like domain-containing protein [bacterium]|nr:carboxypeptidase regulatory-like domain-containing protein [bacterium]
MQLLGRNFFGLLILLFCQLLISLCLPGLSIAEAVFNFGEANTYDSRLDGEVRLSALSYQLPVIADVNGDSIDDLILLASGSDLNGAGSGSVFVVFGGAGLSTGDLILTDPANYHIRLDGEPGVGIKTVSTADLNNDSKADLIVTSAASGSASGNVWIIYSTLLDDTGLSTGNVRLLSDSSSYNLRLGGASGETYEVRPGDVNGDNITDLLLGAHLADNNGVDSGSLWVIFSTLLDNFGSSTGNNLSVLDGGDYNLRYDGEPGDHLTYELNFYGVDTNSDGLGDLVISSYLADNNGDGSGSVWLIFSTLVDDVGETTANNRLLSDLANFNLRYDGPGFNAVLSAYNALQVGDVNGDGMSDLIVGSGQAAIGAGSAWVIFSTLIDDIGLATGQTKSLAVAGNYNIRFDGSSGSDRLTMNNGLFLGDVNGDGNPDLMLGGVWAGNNGFSSGSVWVLFSTLIDDVGGSTGNDKSLAIASNYNVRYDGAFSPAWLNYGHVGDVNGDGLGDLLLGSQNLATAGGLWVMFSTLLDDLGTTTGNNRPLSTPSSYNLQYWATTGDALTRTDRMLAGDVAIGDIDNDGKSDIVVGGPFADNGGLNSGSAWLISSTLVDDIGLSTGNDRLLTNPANYTARYDGDVELSALGSSQVVGDVNGDGIDDLVIGNQNASYRGPSSGSVYVVFGRNGLDLPSGSLTSATNYNIRFDGEAGDLLGSAKSMVITDLTGDGVNDLLLGSSSADINGVDSGAVWVISSAQLATAGNSTGNIRPLSVATNFNARFDGAAAGDVLSSTGTIRAGDVNGDGLADLILGASQADNNGLISGSVWIVFSTLVDDYAATTGNILPLSVGSNYNIRYDGGAAGQMIRPGLVADTNGDGVSDLTLDAPNASYGATSSGSAWIIFSTLLDDVGLTTGNNKALSVGGNYNLRYDSVGITDQLKISAAADVNGDSLSDLILSSYWADNNGSNSGSAWVIFSTLIDDVGSSTGNVRLLSTASTYNIRYDGEGNNLLTYEEGVVIADIDSDGLNDLLLASERTNSNAGSVWLIASTLLDDVGMTTGNIKLLSDLFTYNIRIDGAVSADLLGGKAGSISVGDVNSDGVADLTLAAMSADNNGTNSGSVWTIYSMTLLPYMSTTGNVLSLANGADYDLRFDGASAGDQLGYNGLIGGRDLNNDGAADLLMPNVGSDHNGTNSGSIYVVYGDPFVYTISGTVSAGGSSLAGVSIDGGALGVTTTDNLGNYSFANVAKLTDYTLTPSLVGYSFSPLGVLSTALADATHNFVATLNTYSLSGTVTSGGSPVSGATVTLTLGGGTFTATTGNNGNYSFSGVTPGTGIITVVKGGLELVNETVNVTPGTTSVPVVVDDDVILLSPLYSFWNGFLGMVNVLELMNTGDSPANVDVEMYDLDGTVVSTVTINLPAGTQRDFILNDLDGFSTTSYGLLKVDGGNAALDGRVTSYRPSSDTWGDEFDFVYSLELSPETTGETMGMWNTYAPAGAVAGLGMPGKTSTLSPNWLSVANLDNSTRNFTVTYRDQEGGIITITSLNIPAHGKRDIQAGHEFLASPAVGSITVTPEDNSTPYIATITRYGDNFAFATPTRSGTEAETMLPAGGEGLSVLELANASNATNHVELNWYDMNGILLKSETAQLGAYSQQHFIPTDVLPQGSYGSVVITPSDKIIAGAASYLYDNAGSIATAHYLEGREVFGKVLSGTFNTYLDMYNWLRVTNNSASDQFALVDFGAGDTESVYLPAHGRRDLLIPNANTGDSYGSFALKSSFPGTVSASIVRRREITGEVDYQSVVGLR